MCAGSAYKRGGGGRKRVSLQLSHGGEEGEVQLIPASLVLVCALCPNGTYSTGDEAQSYPIAHVVEPPVLCRRRSSVSPVVVPHKIKTVPVCSLASVPARG